jgi:hypothetical protein
MNSPIPDDDVPHMPAVLRALKDLAGRLTRLEKRSTAYPATSSLPPSHLPKIPKKSNFPPPIPTTNYRLPKTEVEGSEKGKERQEREETRDQGNPKRPSANAASTSSHPASSAKPSRDATAIPPAQTEDHPQRVYCTLWVPDSLVGHLVGQVGRGLKLAATISKARIAVSGPSAEPGATRKATIHGTSEEVGMALVVMGKRITQQRVPNPRSKPKPKKPTPITSSTAAEGRPPPALHASPARARDPLTAADFAAGREAARVAALLTWPPDGIPSFAPRTPPTPGAWDGEPAAHRKGAAPRVQGRTSPDRDPPTAERYSQVMARIDAERRGATPLQRSTMPAPSWGWKPPSTTTPGCSSRWRKTTTGPKPPGGQAAAPVAAVDTHPERRDTHPLNANPCQSTTISRSSSGWKPKDMDPKPPDGEAAAPDADTGLPPERPSWIAPIPGRP